MRNDSTNRGMISGRGEWCLKSATVHNPDKPEPKRQACRIPEFPTLIRGKLDGDYSLQGKVDSLIQSFSRKWQNIMIS